MNNRLEQDHRGPKSRIGVMKGFKNIFNAQIFCTAFEEIRLCRASRGHFHTAIEGYSSYPIVSRTSFETGVLGLKFHSIGAGTVARITYLIEYSCHR